MRILITVAVMAAFGAIGCSSESNESEDVGADTPIIRTSCPEPGTVLVDARCEDRRGIECGSDSECGTFDVCDNGICSRVTPDLETELVPDFPAPGPNVEDPEILVSPAGWGGALFDGDGDGTLDVLVGGPAGFVRLLDSDLSPHSELVLPEALQTREIYLGHAIEIDGDAGHELVVAGTDWLGIIDWGGEAPTFLELSSNLPVDEPCNLAMAMPTDLDDDGDLDLYVACMVHHYGNIALSDVAVENPPRKNFAVRQVAPDEWVFDPALSPLDQASTLAVGLLDWNDDGATDLLLPNDHSVGDGVRNPFLVDILGPGAVLIWTPEGHERRPLWGAEDESFGNLMGVTELFIEDDRHLYLSDVSRNVLVDLEQTPPGRVRQPAELVRLPGADPSDPLDPFAWGVVASDFDRDGSQEVFVARGLVAPQFVQDLQPPPEMLLTNTDLLFMSRGDGTFELTEELAPQEQAEEDWLFQSRGAHALDLDLDGEQDLFVFGLYFHETELLWRPGLVRYRVRSSNHGHTPPACTLIPQPSLVPAMNGYGIRETGTDFFRTENDGGQIRFGTSPWPVSTYGAGTLRFASGALVAFDCLGEPGPFVIEEPVGWLSVRDEDGTLRVCVDEDVWGARPSDVTVFGDGTEETLEVDGACWTSDSLGGPVHVRLDGRWIAHRFN